MRVNKLVTMASISGFRNLWPQAAEAQWKIQGLMYIANTRTNQQMPLKSTLLADLDAHPARLNVLEKASAIKQPWLIIHGDADVPIPPTHAEALKTVQPGAELLVMHGADHTFGAAHPWGKDTLPLPLEQFCERVVQFFK